MDVCVVQFKSSRPGAQTLSLEVLTGR